MEIDAGNDDAVQTPVAAVLDVGGGLIAHMAVDEGDVIAVAFRLCLEALQNGGEIFVAEAAAAFVHKEHTQIEAAVGLQGPGHGIGHVAHFLCGGADPAAGLFADVLLAVQGFADGGHGNTAFFAISFMETIA